MKLVIDIPDKIYETVQNGIYCGTLYEELKNGIPLSESEDCVSRQAVLEIIRKCHCEEWVKADIGAPIEALQSVTPAEKVGEWMYGESFETGRDGWFCSKCGHFEFWDYSLDMESARRNLPNICPDCSAKMGGEQNE